MPITVPAILDATLAAKVVDEPAVDGALLSKQYLYDLDDKAYDRCHLYNGGTFVADQTMRDQAPWLTRLGIMYGGQDTILPEYTYTPIFAKGCEPLKSSRLLSIDRYALWWYYHWSLCVSGVSLLWLLVATYPQNKYIAMNSQGGHSYPFGEGAAVRFTRTEITEWIFGQLGKISDDKKLTLSSSINNILLSYSTKTAPLGKLGLYEWEDDETGHFRPGTPHKLPKALLGLSLLHVYEREYASRYLRITDFHRAKDGPGRIFGASYPVIDQYVNNLKRHSVIDDYSNTFYSAYILYAHGDYVYPTHHYSAAIQSQADIAKLLFARHFRWRWAWEIEDVSLTDFDPGDYWDNREYPKVIRRAIPEYKYWSP